MWLEPFSKLRESIKCENSVSIWTKKKVTSFSFPLKELFSVFYSFETFSENLSVVVQSESVQGKVVYVILWRQELAWKYLSRDFYEFLWFIFVCKLSQFTVRKRKRVHFAIIVSRVPFGQKFMSDSACGNSSHNACNCVGATHSHTRNSEKFVSCILPVHYSRRKRSGKFQLSRSISRHRQMAAGVFEPRFTIIEWWS